MKIGARIVKTGLAVTITMYICKFFDFEPAFFGAVSAVINMQPSIFLTFKTAWDQILVHVIGVTAAIALGYIIGGHPVSMGIITIFIIMLYRKIGLHGSISGGVVAAVFILSSSQDQFLSHALLRTGVVFTGLFTAMVVNILLWPPKYGQAFRDKLSEANEQAVLYFSQALHAYATLRDASPSMNEKQRLRVQQLNAEVRNLADLCKNEASLFSTVASKQHEWFATAKRLRDYNESLLEKADRIYDLLPVRYERRQELSAPEITAAFQNLLDLLAQGDSGVVRVNEKLRRALLHGESVVTEEISETYWNRLRSAIELWQPEIDNPYYIHELIEVASVASEIKSAARNAKRLLQECFTKGLI